MFMNHRASAWSGRWTTRSGGAPHGGGQEAAGASTCTRQPSRGASAVAAREKIDLRVEWRTLARARDFGLSPSTTRQDCIFT
jgi:hypothetical protein